MSDLHIALAAAGVALVGLVYGYNVFQEWRFRDKTDKSFAREQDDVLVDRPVNQVRDGTRLDPVILDEAKTSAEHFPANSDKDTDKPIETWSAAVVEPDDEPEPVAPEVVVAVAAAVVDEMENTRSDWTKNDAPDTLEAKPTQESKPPQEMSAGDLSQHQVWENFAASAANHESQSAFVTTEPVRAETAPADRAEVVQDTLGQQLVAPASVEVIPADQQLFMRALLDPNIDFMAELRFEAPTVLASLPKFSTRARVQILGANASGRWQVVETAPHDAYVQLDIGLQMVSRDGVIPEQELQQFCQELNAFAGAHGAAVQHPQQTQQLASARSLDAFCAEVDILIGLNVRLRAPTEFAKLLELTEKEGLIRQEDGTFQALSDSGSVLFTVTGKDDLPFAGEWIEWVTILLDVPRVAGGLEVFERALAFARQVSQDLNGVLVDDNNRTLLDSGLDSIRARLVQIYALMDDRGIAPGSMAALRVFQ